MKERYENILKKYFSMFRTAGQIPAGLKGVLATHSSFKTGSPAKFQYMKNPSKAPNMGAIYGQNIEPHGFYCSEYLSDYKLPEGWAKGVAEVDSPLVLRLGYVTDGTSWKQVLNDVYKLRGKSLTRKLLQAGFDSIVTVDGTYTGEIVLLKPATQIRT